MNQYFNSIKVRLELTQRVLKRCVRCSFQFHKGTIRTVSPIVGAGLSLLFQFHKGTIRTMLREVNLNGITDFNSIKVRLELK